MVPSLEKNWLSLLYTGSLIVFGSWALTSLSGCRFGNYVESSTNPDQLTGYYESQPQSLTYCVVAGAGQSTCKDAATNLVPSEIANVMTNPMALAMNNLATGDATLYGVSSSGSLSGKLPTTIGTAPQLQISFDGSVPAQGLFADSACTLTMSVHEEGQVNSTGRLLLSTSLKRKGRIEVKYEIIQEIAGDCAASLQLMHDCYLDANHCGGASTSENNKRQALTVSTFDAYIQAGAMTVDDILTASKLSYEVRYQ